MDLDPIRRRLENDRDELLAQDQITEDDRATVELDQTSVGRLSRMDAIQRQAMAQAGQQRRQLERRRIEAALERIEAGDYGFCVRCGEAIAPKRIELNPAIATCIGCAGD